MTAWLVPVYESRLHKGRAEGHKIVPDRLIFRMLRSGRVEKPLFWRAARYEIREGLVGTEKRAKKRGDLLPGFDRRPG